MIISFRCFYPDHRYTNHYQDLDIKDIPRWIEAYAFTHPDVQAITARVNIKGEDDDNDN